MTDLDHDPLQLSLGFLPAFLRAMDIPLSSGDARRELGTALYETIRQRPYPVDAPLSVQLAHFYLNELTGIFGGVETGTVPPAYLPEEMTYTQLSGAMGAVALQAYFVSTTLDGDSRELALTLARWCSERTERSAIHTLILRIRQERAAEGTGHPSATLQEGRPWWRFW